MVFAYTGELLLGAELVDLSSRFKDGSLYTSLFPSLFPQLEQTEAADNLWMDSAVGMVGPVQTDGVVA